MLDRLIDDAPRKLKDGPDQSITTAQLRQHVLRDLAWLLNTSNLATLEDLSSTPLVSKSTLNYGIPGFAGLLDSSGKASNLERDLAEAIRTFEPRIRPDTLKVRARSIMQDGAAPTLLFHIEGELWAQPAPLQLFIETTIEIETRQAVVAEAREVR